MSSPCFISKKHFSRIHKKTSVGFASDPFIGSGGAICFGASLSRKTAVERSKASAL